jgi:hypothetical protein
MGRVTRQGDPMTVGQTRQDHARVLEERPTVMSNQMLRDVNQMLHDVNQMRQNHCVSRVYHMYPRMYHILPM